MIAHSIFDVKSNIIIFGKAYAFYAVRKHVGTISALYMLWVACHMNHHETNKLPIKYI